MPATSASQRISPPTRLQPAGERLGRARRRRPRAPGSRRSGRASSAGRPSARSRARRAGCRRARRCRRAGGAASSPPNGARPRSAAGREQGLARSAARRPRAGGARTPSPARTGGKGVSSAPTRCVADPVPLARTARSQASPSPGCCGVDQRGGHLAVAVQQRPLAVVQRVARAPPARAARPARAPRGAKTRIVRRGGEQRVEGAERVVHEVRVRRRGRCAPRRPRRAAPRGRAPTSRASARWLAATSPLGPAPTTTASYDGAGPVGTASALATLGDVGQPAQRLGVAPVQLRRRAAASGISAPGPRPRPPRSRPRSPRRPASACSATSAAPAGQARALSRAASPGCTSSTSVVSSMSSGQLPTEWWSRAPTAGHVVVDLAHPGGADHPQRVEPAVGQDVPDLLRRGVHRPCVGAHAGRVPGGRRSTRDRRSRRRWRGCAPARHRVRTSHEPHRRHRSPRGRATPGVHQKADSPTDLPRPRRSTCCARRCASSPRTSAPTSPRR